MFEKGDWPDPESKPQIGTEAVKKPGEGLLHKPGEWAETPPEAGTKENIPEGVLHKPSAWDRPAPPEPPKGRPQPDQKGAFYEPAKPEFRNAANPDPSALPPSHHADAMLHNPSSWATFSSKPEPKDTPLSFEGHVKHEALLHNKENWDRFVKDEKPVSNLEKKALPGVGPHREPLLLNKNMRDDSGRIAFQGTDSGFNPALPNQPHKEPLLHNRDEWDRFTGKKDKPEDIEKRGTLYHQPSTPPRPGESKPNTTAPPSKGLFHRPDAWKSKDKGGPGANRGNTPPGMPDYPRKARPPEDKRKK